MVHGKPTGAVRISFGYMSTFEDAKKFIDFIKSSFVSVPTWSGIGNQLTAMPLFLSEGQSRKQSSVYLKSISIYPIKSCAGFDVESWPLSSTGNYM
uniref:Molybdenum cofactor sulfurase MCS MOS MoCo sulfurase Molybdenum cofactor sulfurtransferase n=1 Tax=Rhizophora mucronata TaxID=61149 RepID=A0A2P2KNL5_RHIMU